MSKVRSCNGGMVQFGMTGNAAGVYASKHMPCISPYQDAKYGRGMRLHTVSGKDPERARCTVCGYGNGVVRP